MKMWAFYPIAAGLATLAALAAWRQLDRRADALAWATLVQAADAGQRTYDPAMVDGLPEPARRYFNYTIDAGAPLHTLAEIDMTGQIGLGTKDAPKYRTMRASQILSPPNGLVWQLRTGPISGSDVALPSRSWTRFWLFDLIPIVRAGDQDHHRSAFGRVVAEAAFWAPASLLPSEHVYWEALDEGSARAVVSFGRFEQAVDITVAEDGAPSRVEIRRWSNENADREYREQPFGGLLSEYRHFAGYRLPTRVEGGNHFGTPDYFPFFKAKVIDIRFPSRATSP